MADGGNHEGVTPALSIAHGAEIEPGTRPASLAEGLKASLDAFPDGRFVFLDAEGRSVVATYSETFARARRILHGLRRQGVRAGDPLILYFRECRDFIPTLWAALLAGAIPVPLMRNDASRHHASRAPRVFAHLRGVLGAPRVVTDGDDAVTSEAGSPMALGDIESETQDTDFFAGSVDDPCLLVLTSGTTADPQLVTLSARAIINRWWPTMPAADQASTFLSWSPFDHVMGLGFAGPNLRNKVYLPASAFVREPVRWLAAVETFGVTHATMTNFGMSLIGQAVAGAPHAKWDLSSLHKIGAGAEAISPAVCTRFIEALRPSGLRSDAVILGYGLSECGPVVGGAHPFTPDEKTRTDAFAVLDGPTRGHSVRIVGADGAIVSTGVAGAIEVKGATMTLGYWGDEAATRALFTDDGWIRTGDLGLLADGRLTVTGRAKEIIVINARKYACAEIEAVAQSVAGVREAYAVACDKPAHTPSFAIFFVAPDASSPDLEELRQRLRTTVAATFGMTPAHIVNLASDEIPRTANGKVQRLELAARLSTGEFAAPSGRDAPPTPGAASETERRVAAIWEQVLGGTGYGADQDFFDLGGDSLAAESLTLALEQAFGKRLPPELLLRDTTIARFAAFFDGRETVINNQHPPMDAQTSSYDLDPEIDRRLRALSAVWPHPRVSETNSLFVLNREGKQRPLFWCLQSPEEFAELANALGPDQPVYAMRSGFLAMEHTPENIAALARRYAAEIMAIDPNGPYLIGGVCAGGTLALAIARAFQASQHHVQLLTLLDVPLLELVSPHGYTGKTVCFIGVKSRFNPLRRFRHPETGWNKFFPAGLKLQMLSADYAEFFSNSVMSDFAPKFRAALGWAEAKTAAATGRVGALPASTYRTEFQPLPPMSLAAGGTATLAVAVKNLGSIVWEVSRDSGIYLGNHWLTPEGEAVVWSDARVPLYRRVYHGETATIPLAVRAPAQPGAYVLEIDLVEEGVAWFKDKGAPALSIDVRVTAAADSKPRRR